MNGGTLVAAGYSANRYRRDVYDILEWSVIFPKVLALELGNCYPLARFVAKQCDSLKNAALLALEESLGSLALTEGERQSRLESEAARWPDTQDSDTLAGWVASLDERDFDSLAASVCQWMDGVPDWDWEPAYFSKQANGQSAAIEFFNALPIDVLTSLGVAIVEGEGASRIGRRAELRISANDANRAAKKADLPICFQSAMTFRPDSIRSTPSG